MFWFQALIKEIDPTYDEHAYLDRSLEISRAESYVEGPPTLTSHYVKYALAYTYVDLPLLLLMFTIFLLETTVVPPHLRSNQLSSIDFGRRVSTNIYDA